jgi:hypothetical protein
VSRWELGGLWQTLDGTKGSDVGDKLDLVGDSRTVVSLAGLFRRGVVGRSEIVEFNGDDTCFELITF